MLRYLGDERGLLTAKEVQQVESTLNGMKSRFGYCDYCAKDALLLLITKRYTD
jgi:serine protein kinase